MSAALDRRQALGWGVACAALLLPGRARDQAPRSSTVLLQDPALTEFGVPGRGAIHFDLADLSWRDALAVQAQRPGALVRGITPWSGMVVAHALLAPFGVRPLGSPVHRGPAILWYAGRTGGGRGV